jgi:hypothetical protein
MGKHPPPGNHRVSRRGVYAPAMEGNKRQSKETVDNALFAVPSRFRKGGKA